MLLPVGVEVASGRLEGRTFARSGFVDVEPVDAGRQPPRLQSHHHHRVVLELREIGLADPPAFRVEDHRFSPPGFGIRVQFLAGAEPGQHGQQSQDPQMSHVSPLLIY